MLGLTPRPLDIAFRILISDQNFGDDAAVERVLVAEAGGALALADCRSEPDVIAALQAEQPDALLVQFAPIGAAAIESAGALRAIVRYGVGLDNVDTDAARAAGIQLGLVPDYCVDEVADHTFALLLAVARGVVKLTTNTQAGGWDWRAAQPLRRLRGQTLGLLGYGRVGQAVAERASGFGLKTVLFDPATRPRARLISRRSYDRPMCSASTCPSPMRRVE